MDTGEMLVFSTAFITQFTGHKIGDYFFQTNDQAVNKSTKFSYLMKHTYIYSFVIGLLMGFMFNWWIAAGVFCLTAAEHIIIDGRWPVVGWKNFYERKIARNKEFDTKQLPFFVLIEIDQTIHIMRIFVISLLIAYQII